MLNLLRNAVHCAASKGPASSAPPCCLRLHYLTPSPRLSQCVHWKNTRGTIQTLKWKWQNMRLPQVTSVWVRVRACVCVCLFFITFVFVWASSSTADLLYDGSFDGYGGRPHSLCSSRNQGFARFLSLSRRPSSIFLRLPHLLPQTSAHSHMIRCPALSSATPFVLCGVEISLPVWN